VESFEVEDAKVLLNEYDEDEDEEYEDSEGECDYPDTPDERSLEEHWGGEAHSSDESDGRGSDSSSGEYKNSYRHSIYKHGYDQEESQEEYAYDI